MLSGKYKGQDIGSGTNTWSMSEAVRAGTMRLEEFHEAESCMHRSHGHCMTMGTASTMASMVEALGIGLPGNAAYPAVDARRNLIARMAGRRARWKPPVPPMSRGYVKLYVDHVNQANEGCDLDFLVGGSGPGVPRDNH